MIILSNSGTHPELIHVARELSKRGEDYFYLTSASFPSDGALASIIRSPAVRNTRMGRSIRRRIVDGLPSARLKLFGLSDEIAFQLAVKLAPSIKENLLDRRVRKFRLRASRFVSKLSNVKLVYANYTSAAGLFDAVGASTRKVLIYPIAHHGWMQKYLDDEANSNPLWAKYLQGNELSESRRDLLDHEIALADLIIVASSFVKATFISQGIPGEKIAVLPLGVDRDSLWDLESPTVVSHPHESGLRLLFVGQVNQRKGIGYLLDAFSEARLEGARLTIVGPFTADMSAEIARYRNVELHRSMPRFELGRFYRDADLLVLPSLVEGFGLVALEAMSVGTACVVTPNTLGVDVITDGMDGYIVPAGSTAALVQVFRRAATNLGEVRVMGERAARTAQAYTWDEFATQILRC